MKHLTIRSVPDDVASALSAEKARRGVSLNQTVIELLRNALGLGPVPVENGLTEFAGRWSEAEYEEFRDSMGVFDQIDDELWS